MDTESEKNLPKFSKREMDIPPEKHAHVCLACKGKNGSSNFMDSHETDETWQGCVQSSKPMKRAWVTETGPVFVMNKHCDWRDTLYQGD